MTHPFIQSLSQPESSGNPFLDSLQSGDDGGNPLLQTAVGRTMYTQQNIANNTSKLQAIADNPATTPEHRKIILDAINNMQSETHPSDLWHPGFFKSDFDRNITSGALEGLMGPAYMAATGLNKLGVPGAQWLKDKITQAQATGNEAIEPTNNTSGTVERFIGSLAEPTAILGYGAIAELTAKPFMSAGAKMLPGVAQAINEGLTSPSALTRILTGAGSQIAKGLPFSTLAAMGMDNSDSVDKAKAMLFQAGADALFGGYSASGQPTAGVQGNASDLINQAQAQEAEAAKAPATDHSDQTQADLAQLRQAAADRATARAQREKIKRLARAEYEQNNPDNKWSDMTGQAQKSYIDDFTNRLGSDVQTAVQNPSALPPSPEAEAPTGAALAGAGSEGAAPSAVQAPAQVEAPTETPTTPAPEAVQSNVDQSVSEQPAVESATGATPDQHPFIQSLGIEEAPPPSAAPVDPMQAKLDALKAKMAAGAVTPQAPPSPAMTVAEMQKGYYGSRQPGETLGNWVGRLGTLQSEWNQHVLESELNGVDPMQSQIEGVDAQTFKNILDEQLAQSKRYGQMEGMTPNEVQSAYDNKQYTSKEDLAAQSETAARERTAASMIGSDEKGRIVNTALRAVAERTGETPEQVRTRLLPQAIASEQEALGFSQRMLADGRSKEIWTNEGNKHTARIAALTAEMNGTGDTNLNPSPTPTEEPVEPTPQPQPSPPAEAQGPPAEVSPPPAREPNILDQPLQEGVKKPSMNDPEYNRLRRIPLRSMSNEDLKTFADKLDQRLQAYEKADPARQTVQALNDRVVAEQAKRASPDGYGKVVAQSPPAIGGAAIGAVYGYVTGQDDSDRLQRALMYGAIGAGAGYALGKLGERAIPVFRPVKETLEPEMPAWEKAAAKKVINYQDAGGNKPGFIGLLRQTYQATIHGAQGLHDYEKGIGATGLTASKSPYKLATMVGEWVSRVEAWATGRPSTLIDDPTTGGKAVQTLPIKSLREIHDLVDGDTNKLGRVAVAYASEELRGTKAVPYDEATSALVLANAEEKFHVAARALREYHAALVGEMVKTGIISKEGQAAMMNESWYTPLWRILDSTTPIGKESDVIGSQNPVKARQGGSEMSVRNPWESTIEMTGRVMRASEMNNIKQAMLDLYDSVDKKVSAPYLQRIGTKAELSPESTARIEALKQSIPGLSNADAQSLESSVKDSKLPPNSNIMTAYRDGVLQSYKVNDEIARSFRSLMPAKEWGIVSAVLGPGIALERAGVTASPWFIFKRSFVDTWLATLNSMYGFRPGVDSFLGWWNIMHESPAFAEYRAAGGGNASLASGRFGDLQSAIKELDNPRGFGGVAKGIKTLNFAQAWRDLAVPMLEASRMGEYLRARGKGADVIQASFAAKHVIGNFGMHGSSPFMMAINRGTLFLNPTLQALDHGIYRMGVHPFRAPEEGRAAAAVSFLTKAAVTMTLPSIYLWMHNMGDQDIDDLRKSEGGSRFWYFRSPMDTGIYKAGEIVRIPKPELAGHIFGTTAEHALDLLHGNDSEGFTRIVRDAIGDIAPNVIPQSVGIAFGLAANHDFSGGGQVVNQGAADLLPQYQANQTTPTSLRILGGEVGKAAANLPPDGALGTLRRAMTPAGLQFLSEQVGGSLGSDALSTIGQAVDYVQKGMVPPKAELPIVGQFFQRDPTLSVGSVEEFYKYADRVDEVAKSLDYLTRNRPEQIPQFLEAHQDVLPLIGLMSQSRTTIANYTGAIDNIRQLSGETIDPATRLELMNMYKRLIVDQARMSNDMRKQLSP